MNCTVAVIGGGLAGCEAALQLSRQGVRVTLHEMRPNTMTPVHKGEGLAELVCSNSLKSLKPDSAAGMLKHELSLLNSPLLGAAMRNKVAAGGALAVDREAFSADVTSMIRENPLIDVVREEVSSLEGVAKNHDAVILATGPMTSDSLSSCLEGLIGSSSLAFYDAAAPIVMADSLDMGKIFRQSRYEDGEGDYLNAPFTRERYEEFIDNLLRAERVIKKDFETDELFQACQPIEEIAKKGNDAPRFGPMKPVGLTDPTTGRRPWAAVQLRAEDADCQSFNLVGFQTNLTFPEQRRVFRMIPGLENAEFARYGVMHRNTFIDAPDVLDRSGLLESGAGKLSAPVFVAGQLSGTEGYCEAIRSGANCAIGAYFKIIGEDAPDLSTDTAFGALMGYATSSNVKDYQPMHVNFGIIPPLETRVRNKRQRYETYAKRGNQAMELYVGELVAKGFKLEDGR